MLYTGPIVACITGNNSIPGINNGHYKRNLNTKYGGLKELKVPRNRDNRFHSAVIEANKTIGLEGLITSLCSNGASTRKIPDILSNIFKNRHSPSPISRITDMTLEEANKFLNRKLDNRHMAVILDGLFFYLRRGTADRDPVIFALGIKESGEYEILGFYLAIKEFHNNYKGVLEDLCRGWLKVISSLPDVDYSMKISYLKSIKFNSKHIFRKMDGYIKCNGEIKEMFNKRYTL